MASLKLDTVTSRNWEEYRSRLPIPTIHDFYTFLRERANILETVNAGKSSIVNVKNERRYSLNKTRSFISYSDPTLKHNQCILCNQIHKLHECLKFKTLPVIERNSKVC